MSLKREKIIETLKQKLPRSWYVENIMLNESEIFQLFGGPHYSSGKDQALSVLRITHSCAPHGHGMTLLLVHEKEEKIIQTNGVKLKGSVFPQELLLHENLEEFFEAGGLQRAIFHINKGVPLTMKA